VQVRPLLRDESVAVALLRFEPGGAIDEHSADYEIDVICLEGTGFTKLGQDVAEISEGARVRWTRGVIHGLWTTDASMLTLMIEHR
jgi:quercetin dioxygenase-like cupin family protein